MTRPHYPPGGTAVITVRNRSGRKSLGEYLAARLGVVLPWAEGLLADGCVSLDGTAAAAGETINLSAGPHVITIRFPEAWPRHMAATEMALNVLYEDSHILVLDKPAGTVVHPARGHLDNRTLQNGVRHRYRHLLADPDATVAPPHRLDKETSGVVVFALTRRAYIDLSAQFAAGTPVKEYVAVADGRAEWTECTADGAIGPDPTNKGRGRIVPVTEGGKRAVTAFTVLELGRDWTILRAMPKTGRAHQIRIHAAGLGLPLAGDEVYNPAPGRLNFPRQALHAAALTIRHPGDGRQIRFAAALPGDMAEGIARLRLREREREAEG